MRYGCGFVLLVMLGCLILVGCDNAARVAWENACRNDNVESYRAFLSEHKESKFSAQAFNRLAELEFQRVSQSKSIVEMKNYSEEFANTEWGGKVKHRIDKIQVALRTIEQDSLGLDRAKVDSMMQFRTGNSPTFSISCTVRFEFPAAALATSIDSDVGAIVRSNLLVFKYLDGYNFYCIVGNGVTPGFPENYSIETDIVEFADRFPEQLTPEDYFRLWRVMISRDIDNEIKSKGLSGAADHLSVLKKLPSDK
jgi:hypothetical protein